MTKSTHKAEVVPINLEIHPNADSLSVVRVFAYTVCVKTEDWIGKDKAVYIVPDSLVDTTRPEFAFLHTDKQFECIKVKKLRGVVSMGLLIPCPEGFNIGDDCAEYLGVERYEPPSEFTMGDDNCGGPSGVYTQKYDIDSYHRYLDLFEDGEPVYISEKIHGANARYVYTNEMFCGSRTQWKKQKDTNIWWRVLANTPAILEFCQKYPQYTLYGEVYGQVQNLKYGLNNVGFVAFDILRPDGKFLDADDFMEMTLKYHIPSVPIIKNDWPLDKSTVLEFAEGRSILHWSNIGGQLQNCHVREGCVIKPMKERYHESIGRVCLKIVGNGYYEKVK